MLLLIIAGFFLFLGVPCFIRHRNLEEKGTRNDWGDTTIVCVILAIACIVAAFIASGMAWTVQLSDFENVKKFRKIEAIYQTKAEMLTTEFVKHLAETYPEHEKEIYDKISPDNVYLYFVKYPELRSSETIVALVDRINKLQSDVYEQQIKAEETLQKIRFRPKNPWLLRFMIPREEEMY